MYSEEFKRIYSEPRNGCNFYVRALLTGLVYTDGVQALADTGCHWLLDVIGTEFKAALLCDPDGKDGALGTIAVEVKDGQAWIFMHVGDEDLPTHKTKIHWTDMPDGTWTFFIQRNESDTVLILPTEY